MRIIVYMFIINFLAIKLTGKYCRYELAGYHEGNVTRKKLISILSVLGGAYGKYLAVWMNDKKSFKERPLETLFDMCLVTIQAYALLFFIKVNDFIPKHTLQEFRQELIEIGIIVGISSVIAFIVYLLVTAGEENISKKKKRVLIALSIIGGCTGEILAMHISRTKNKIEWISEGLKIIWITKAIVLVFVTLQYMYV